MKFKNLSRLAALACSATILFGCEEAESPTSAPVERPAFKQISLSTRQGEHIKLSNEMAFNLFKSINANPMHRYAKNKVISPLSIYMLLSMLANGDDGVVAQEIINVLAGGGENSIEDLNNLNSYLLTELPKVDQTTKLAISNSLWLNQKYSCNASFKALLTDCYDGDFQEVDFGNKSTLKNLINDWVEDKTAGMIKNFANEDNLINQTAFVVNASYFKGTWKDPFPAEQSKNAVFHSSTGDQKITMMHTQTNFLYYADETVQAIELPYGSSNYSMWVLLPCADTGTDRLISELDPATMQNINQSMRDYEVELALPRWSAQSRLELNVADFKNLGILNLFTSGLPGICNEHILNVDYLLTQTCINVDETGTEAAAASMNSDYTAPDPFIKTAKMTVDHPFIFIIKEASTNAIMFMGVVNQI